MLHIPLKALNRIEDCALQLCNLWDRKVFDGDDVADAEGRLVERLLEAIAYFSPERADELRRPAA